jgi:uncharacterized membrane protein
VTQRAISWLAVVLTVITVGATPAHAEFNVCNQFERRIDVAFGYVDRARGWVAQGWWILDAGQCKNLHNGDLDNRYYYLFIRSIGEVKWSGEVPFCIQKKKFLLVQAEYGKNTPDDCAKAGLDYAQFFKVDVGGAKSHTYNLVATSNAGTPGGVPGGEPPRPPVATVPPPQPPPQQQPPAYQPPQQTYQQGPPTYQQTPQPPTYQQAPPTYRPPVATQQPSPQVPQPYKQTQQPQFQQAPQQAAPQPTTPGGGTACQRYPNLC